MKSILEKITEGKEFKIITPSMFKSTEDNTFNSMEEFITNIKQSLSNNDLFELANVEDVNDMDNTIEFEFEVKVGDDDIPKLKSNVEDILNPYLSGFIWNQVFGNSIIMRADIDHENIFSDDN